MCSLICVHFIPTVWSISLANDSGSEEHFFPSKDMQNASLALAAAFNEILSVPNLVLTECV